MAEERKDVAPVERQELESVSSGFLFTSSTVSALLGSTQNTPKPADVVDIFTLSKVNMHYLSSCECICALP